MVCISDKVAIDLSVCFITDQYPCFHQGIHQRVRGSVPRSLHIWQGQLVMSHGLLQHSLVTIASISKFGPDHDYCPDRPI